MALTVEDLAAAMERHDSSPHSSSEICMTIVGRSSRGLGVRPRLLDQRADGTKIYALSRKQVQLLHDRLAANPKEANSGK